MKCGRALTAFALAAILLLPGCNQQTVGSVSSGASESMGTVAGESEASTQATGFAGSTGAANASGNTTAGKARTTAGTRATAKPTTVPPASSEPDEKPAVLPNDYKPAASAPVTVKGTKYYVSAKDGNDNNPGTLEKPFKTISKAAAILKAGDACYIREGTYRETVKPANSGTADAPILFSAYNNEKVVISGADVISSAFKVYEGKIYTTDVSDSLGVGKDQIFVDGDVVIEARYPNEDVRSVSPVKASYSPLFPTRGYFSVNSSITNRITSLFLDQPENFWKGGLYVGGNNVAWTWQTATITGSKSGQLTVSDMTGQWWFPRDVQSAYSAEMSEGYITNTLNALDIAGEWYIGDNKLYIWMPDGDAPAKHTVEMKKRELALDLTSKKNIYVFGIDLFAASATLAKSENCTLDMMHAQYTSHFQKFSDARDGYIDGKGSEAKSPMNGQVGIYVSGKNNAVVNSTIQYSAGAGIYLAGYGTKVENNLIQDTGYACTYVSGIFADEEYGTESTKDNILLGNYSIKYNTICNTGRSAISFNSSGSRIAQYAGSDISYNQLYNNVLFTSDGGAFYAYFVNFSADGNKTKFHHNLVWNCFRRSGEGVVYTDNQCEGIELSDNLGWGHPYANQYFMQVKTDTKNTNNKPVVADSNKFLGLSEAIPAELPHSAYPGGKGFYTGVKHGVDPGSATPPTPSKAAPYQEPEGPLDRTGWKASASSVYNEINEPSMAIDDNPDYTYWRIEDNAQAPGDWFVIDMGKKQTFSRIIMKCGNPKSYNSPRSYTVSVSDDGKTWSDPVAMGDSCEYLLDIRLDKAQTARYVRIDQQEKTIAEWGQFWRILDIQLYQK